MTLINKSLIQTQIMFKNILLLGSRNNSPNNTPTEGRSRANSDNNTNNTNNPDNTISSIDIQERYISLSQILIDAGFSDKPYKQSVIKINPVTKN